MIYLHHGSSCIFETTVQKHTVPFVCNVCRNCNDFRVQPSLPTIWFRFHVVNSGYCTKL